MSGGREDTGETSAGAHLEQELARLATANPFEALGLRLDATGEQIRATFLQLTKKYHPSRFARMDRETVRLANEVFLRVKDAYTRLSDASSRRQLVEMFSPAAPVGRGSSRAPTARGHPAAEPPRKPAEPAAKGRAPASDATLRGAPRASATQRRALARGTPQSGRRPISTRAQTVRGVRQPTARTKRPSDADELERTLRDTTRRRNEDYEMALRMLAQGRFRDARTVFHRIAADDPKTRKFRLQMHYAWGLEHEDAGDYEAARRELERALQVDPEFKRAHEALDRLPDGNKKGSFFKKFFGR